MHDDIIRRASIVRSRKSLAEVLWDWRRLPLVDGVSRTRGADRARREPPGRPPETETAEAAGSIFSPWRSAPAMLPNRVSTMISARFFVRPAAWATSSTSAAFVRLPPVMGSSAPKAAVVTTRAPESPPGDNPAGENDSSARMVSAPATGRLRRRGGRQRVRPVQAARDGGHLGRRARPLRTRGRRLSRCGARPSACAGKGVSGAGPPAGRHDRAARRRGFEGGAQRPSPAQCVHIGSAGS